MDAILGIAESRDLLVIEDAAEAIGSRYKGKPCGALGDLACFSFFANKLVTTGEGGMVVARDERFSERLRYYKNLCFPINGPRRYTHEDIGFNYRMPNVLAAIGLAQLERADFYLECRRNNAARYDERLRGQRGITTPPNLPYTLNSYWMYGILIEDDFGPTRDEVMTLLFAGHDTTTATVAFLLYELARRPDVADAIAAELPQRPPGYEQLMGGALPQLDMALDETLRLYPPAWVGPRRAVRTFEFEGVTVPQGAPVNYSSYVSHRLPDVWDAPHEFRPERFTAERRAALPKGAYVPFGGGSRQCIGMRFGQLEIKAIAARILREHRLELPPRHRLEVRQTPTLGPKGGLPLRVRPA